MKDDNLPIKPPKHNKKDFNPGQDFDEFQLMRIHNGTTQIRVDRFGVTDQDVMIIDPDEESEGQESA